MIKENIIKYRNEHLKSRTLLGVVLGEFEKLEKAPNRKEKEITDTEAINIIKKLIKSNIECGEFEENKLLEKFIPSELQEDQIKIIIKSKQFSSIKECMQYFKENYAGLYDGKLVSKLFQG